MKQSCLRAFFTIMLLAALCVLTGCSAFPRLSRVLRDSPAPFTLEITLEPGTPGGAAVTWDPASAPVDSVEVTVTGEEPAPTLSVTVLLRPDR